MATTLRAFFAFLLALLTGITCAQFGNAAQVHPFGGNAKLKAVDLDGDGDRDLFGIFNDHHLKSFMNLDGAGTFSSAQSIATISGNCHAFELADMNGDLLPDIILVADGSVGVEIFFNDGSGGFLLPGTHFPTPSEPGALACADINGDGHMDLLMTLDLPDGPGFGWFPGSASGLGDLIEVADLHEGPPSLFIAVGDLDLLGGLDVILLGADDLLVMALNTDGDASAWTVAPLPIPEGQPAYPYRSPQLIDVDGDGDLDLAESRGPSVHWLHNELDEGGLLAFTERVVEPWNASGNGTFGRTLCSVGASVVFVPSNPGLPVRWNSFLPELDNFAYSNDLPSLPRGNNLLLADLNNDGRDDLVMAQSSGVWWYANTLTASTTELVLPLLDTLCLNGPPLTLPVASIPGGRWYGTQVSNNLLFRNNIPTSVNLPLVHAAYETEGCPLAATTTMRLINAPQITVEIPSVVCSADAPIALFSDPVSTVWSGMGGSNILDPATFVGGYVVCEYTDVTGSSCSQVEGPILRWNTLPASIVPSGPFCSEDPVQTIYAAAAPPFNVTWEGDITGFTASTATFDPAQGPGEYTVILIASPFAQAQCGNSDTLHITVGASPVIAFSPLPTYCAEGPPIDLTGASPEGGVWSGAGVDAGTLDPTVVGSGVHLLNYFANSADGCASQASTSIELVASVTIVPTASELLLCAGDAPIELSALPAGGAWDAPVSAGGILDPSSLEVGFHDIRYVFTDPRGCVLMNDPLIYELGAPKFVAISPVGDLCTTTPAFDLVGSAPGIWSGALNGVGLSIPLDPALLGPGTYSVTLSVTSTGECPGSATADFVVDICSGIEEVADVHPTLSPNPFVHRSVLLLQGAGATTVELFDATGRKINSQMLIATGPTPIDVDLSGQQAGTYLIVVHTNGTTHRLRAVKAE